ncbi:hypothetical protein HZC09_06300 [Candidatus Micrarchaeota archaeon]|nr:hypothetical protein [Candidatus Micrarchaeota archaeon]
MGFLDIVKAALKYFFLLLFSFILIIDLFALLILFSAQNVVLNADFYKATLEKSDAYGRAYAYIDGEIKKSPLAMLASETKAEDIIPRQWLKAQVNNLIDHGLAYVKGQELYLNLTVYTAEPKQKAMAVVQSKADKLFGADISGAPSNFSKEQMLPMLKAKVDEQVPDSLNLADKFGGAGFLEPVRQGVSILYLALAVLAASAVALMFFIALLAGKVKSIMRWVGFPLLVSGSLCFLALILAKGQLAGLLAGFQGPEGAIIAPIAADVFAALESSVTLHAGIVLLLGLVLLVGSFFVKKQDSAKADVKAEEKVEGKEEESAEVSESKVEAKAKTAEGKQKEKAAKGKGKKKEGAEEEDEGADGK